MKSAYVVKFALPALILTIIACAIIIYPERYITCCLEGFIMWAECVLPSLFPFMVITLIMIKSGFAEKASLPLKKITGIFNLPPTAAVCFIISICSGYPTGCKCLYEFYQSGRLSKSDIKKLSLLCSTSGPLFIIGSVGVKMFSSASVGRIILISHILSVLAISLAISLFSKSKGEQKLLSRPPKGDILYDSFYGAVTAVCVAGGFISFFGVVAKILYDFNFLIVFEKLFSLFCDEQTSSAATLGLIEATKGCLALSSAGGNLSIPLAAFLITFGGASILFQQLAYLLKAGVNPLYFVSIKFIQGVVCFFVTLLLITLI